MKSRSSVITAIAALGVWSFMSMGFASAAPVCYTPTWSVAVPGAVTLFANCTPDSGNSINSSSGYAWKKDGSAYGGAGIQNIDTLTDSSIHTYSVAATDNQSAQGAYSSAVTVSASLPSCTLYIHGGTTTSTSITQGSSATLDAACNSSSDPIEWYANSASNPIADPPGGVVTPAATTNYFVVGSNGYGVSASNQVTVTVTGPVTPLSACTSISPSNPSVTVGSSSPVLTANCSNSPTAWIWKLNGSSISGCGIGSSTCPVPAASLTTVGGSYNVTVTANNAGGTGTAAASATITVTGSTVAGCTVVPITWPSTVQIGVSPVQTMNTGSQFAFQITVNNAATSTAGVLYPTPPSVGRFMSISTSPCAFVNSPTTPVGASCSIGSRTSQPNVLYSTIPNTPNVCQLQMGTRYYINVRNSHTATGADECPSGTACTFYLTY